MIQAVNTLFLSYDGLTDPLGQSQVLPYLLGLSQEGYRVHIISFEKKERWESLGAAIEALCKEKGVQWHPLLYHKSPPVFSTLLDLYQMRSKAAALHKKFSFKLVHARSYPPALVALWLKRKFKVPYLFDIRGFWPEERVEGGIWNLKNPLFSMIYNFFKQKEIVLYKEATAVITLTHKAKEILEQRKDLVLPAITVIPCCADMDHFNPAKVSEAQIQAIRASLKLEPQDYVLCYVGSIGTWYMLEEMLQFFKVLKREQPNAKFLFITRDVPKHIQKTAQQYQVSNDDIRICSATYAEVPQYIAASQASVFFIRPSFSKQASSPTKQGELLAMGKPIVTNSGVGDSDLILEYTKGGVLLHGFSAEEFQKGVEQLLWFNSNEDFTIKTATEIYSLEIGVDKYKQIYEAAI